MVRKDYLSTFDDFFDQELIRVFENASSEIHKLYIQAINVGNITKAHSYLSKLKEIQESIKSDFLLWEELRIQEEYLKGAFYANNIQTPDSLLRELKAVDPKNYLARVDKVEGFLSSLGPIHVEAVKALIEESYGHVSISIDGISKNLLSNLAQIRGIETKMEIAEGVVAGNLQLARDKLIQKFLDQGIASFKDRGGKTRTIERYVDMLVRTETAIANVQGTINRALELGYTKFKVHEQTDCCDICQVYNGNIYDIADGAVELPPYHPHCYHKDTMVMTNEGWKYFWELTGKEKCLSVNPENNETEYVEIKEIISYHEDKLIKFQNYSFDLEVTANHRMLYSSDWHYHNSKKLEFVSAEEMEKSRAKYIPRGIDRKGTEVWDDNFVRFMAMYLSDGSCSILKNGKYRIKIAQDKEKSASGYQRIVEICNNLGYQFYELDAGIEINFEQELGKYLYELGKCNEKYIPEEIKNTSKRQAKIFLNEYVLFDGHARETNGMGIKSQEKVYFTTSKQMMSDLCEMVAKSGGRPSVSTQKPKTIKFKNGEYTQNFVMYTIRHNTRLWSDVRRLQIDYVDYNDLVWCVDLKKYHTLYVMFNGKVCISGNCRGFITIENIGN